MLDLVRDIPAAFTVDLYRRVLERRRSALGYLVVLLVLVSATQAVAAFVQVRGFTSQPGLGDVADKVPHLVIEEGLLRVDAVQPYVLPGPTGQGALAIFDTTGRTQSFGEHSGPGVIFLSDRVLVRWPDGSVRSAGYPPSGRVEVGPVMARAWVEWATRWLAPIVGAAMLVARVVGALVYRVLLAAVWATVTTPARRLVGATAGWADRARLAMVAMTPSILIDAVLVFAARAIETSPGTWISLALLDLAVLGWALSATAPSSSDPTTGEPGVSA